MGKLTGTIRSQIVSELLEPIKNSFNKKSKELEELLQNYIDSVEPIDALNFYNKYPNSLLRKKTIYLHSFLNKGFEFASYSLTLLLEKGYFQGIYFNDSADFYLKLSKIKEYDKVLSILNEMYEIDKNRVRLKNKLTCAIEKINTEKQLKDNFPEAYKAFLSLKKNEEDNSLGNKCDEIENVRAELNSFKNE